MRTPTVICKKINMKGTPYGGQAKYNRDLTSYMANPESRDGNEKCVGTFAYGFTRPEMTAEEAAIELTMDCDLVPALSSSGVDHWVLSFSDTGMDIPLGKIRSTVQGWIADMGYAKYHKVYAAVHRDTDNLHVHMAVCRVNFLNGKLRYRDMWKLDNQKALTRAAKALGWRLEKGSDYFVCPGNVRPEPVIVKDPVFGTEERIYRPKAVKVDRRKAREKRPPYPGDRESRKQCYQGIKCDKTILIEMLGGVLDGLPENPSWLDVHMALAVRGFEMEMRRHGKRRGLVLSLDGKNWISASRVSRELSWSALSRRLGEGFMEAKPEIYENEPEIAEALELVKEIVRVREEARKAGFTIEKTVERIERKKPAPSFRRASPVPPKSAEDRARIDSLGIRRPVAEDMTEKARVRPGVVLK